MKRFYKRALLYLLPLFAIIGAVGIVDPYYLFHSERKFDQNKYDIGYSFDQGRRYKIFTYMHHPRENIILGASEINLVNERNIPEDGWHSLSYGGAPLQESLRMFWEIANLYSLKKVLIAPEFIKYYNATSSGNGDPYYANFSWETSQSAEAFSIYHTPLDYFIDKYTIKSTWQCITGSLGRGKPEGDKTAFWKHQMDYAKKIYLGNEIIPEKQSEIKNSFIRIKGYCDVHGISVNIVIPIQHKELLALEFSEEVYPVYQDYIQFLVETFGSIEYMAYVEGLSTDEAQFSDPFHYITEKPYLTELFGAEKKYLIDKNNIERLSIIKQLLVNE